VDACNEEAMVHPRLARHDNPAGWQQDGRACCLIVRARKFGGHLVLSQTGSERGSRAQKTKEAAADVHAEFRADAVRLDEQSDK
jgi:hypothetical protein